MSLTYYPLTSPQREIWFDQMLHETTTLYNIGGYNKLFGCINPTLFEQAINLLIQKHDALRTILTDEKDEDGLPLQAFLPELTISLVLQDFSDAQHPEQAALTWMQQRVAQPFELIGKPLFRHDLVKTSENCYYWLMQYHHIIVDGYSVALLHRSLAQFYSQLSQGQDICFNTPSYCDYIKDDRAYVESTKFAHHQRYWLDQYPTTPEPLLKPRHHAQVADKPLAAAYETFYLSRQTYQQLQHVAAQHKVTFPHIILGALYAYFTRIAQQDELVVGLPVLNRSNAQFKQTIGLFMGVSPVLFKFGQDLCFSELVSKIKQCLTQHYRYQRFPISALNRAIGIGKTKRSALFDVSLSYQKEDYDSEFNGVNSDFTVLWSLHEQIPLTIRIQDFHAQKEVKLDFVYNHAYFTATEINTLHTRLMGLLQAILSDFATPIRDLPLITATEIQQLQTWNQTQTTYPQPHSIVALFEQQAAQTPNNPAVIYADQVLSYAQLNTKANQLAHYLRAHPALQTIPNPVVALCVAPSCAALVGILGILKAGGAYMPIDPAYPAERIAYMLSDSAASLLLTQTPLSLPTTQAYIVDIDNVAYDAQPAHNLNLPSQPEAWIYVIYTSGSTGQPKGSAVYQRGVLNLLHWYLQTLQLTANDKTLIISALGFDLTQKNLLAPLLIGACVYMPDNRQYDPNDIIDLIDKAGISWLNCAPSAFYPLLEVSQARKPLSLTSLRWLILGGEPIQAKLLQNWLKHHTCTVINSYGPTECTDVSAAYLLENTDLASIPIGTPLPNTRIYILDRHQQPLPPGVAGELCIAGEGVAYGYLNRPALTAEKYRTITLFGKQERIYHTGDLACWHPAGYVDYLGRIDHQIKIRGFRVELGEIEAVLSQHAAIKAAAVVVQPQATETKLIAYVVTAHNAIPNDLRPWLTSHLPAYMLPAHFIQLAALPLTPNGKIDRKTLEKQSETVNLTTDTQNYVAPRNAEEAQLSQIWAQVLSVERVGVYDNFFDLGGHSLSAIQIVARIHEQFKVQLSPQQLFDHPELAALFKLIQATEGGTPLPPLSAQAVNAVPALSLEQEWFWLLNQYDNQGHAHNMTYAWQLNGQLDVAVLRRVACDLVAQHQSLRHCFPSVQGQATIAILAPYDPLTLSDLSHLNGIEQQTQLENHILQQFEQIFVLDTGPLFKLHLVKLTAQQHILCLVVHHIIFDSHSLSLLLPEFQHRYTAYVQQQNLSIPAPELQYTDYAAWQQVCLSAERLKKQLDYWLKQLDGLPEQLNLPTDYPRPAIQHNQGGLIRFQLASSQLEQLNQLARQQQCSLQMLLFSVFVLLLHRYSGQTDICVGVPRTLRQQAQTENMVGLFLNILLLRNPIAPEASFIDLLQQVRAGALAAYSHQDITFSYLLKHLPLPRSTAYNPGFQVMFNFVNGADNSELTLPDLTMQTWNSGQHELSIANLDIMLMLQQQPNGLDGFLLFDQALFKTTTMAYWRDSWLFLLQQVLQHADTPLKQFFLSRHATPRFPLTAAQREIWFDQMLHDTLPLYNIGGRLHLPGQLDLARFEQAVKALVRKHDTLRTLLLNERDEDGLPLQTYAASLEVTVPLHDFSNAENPQQAAFTWMQNQFEKPFTLLEKPLFRYDLVKISANEYYWLLQYHHLIIDGWGIALLNRSLAEIYTQLCHGQQPDLSSPSYTAYIANDRDYIDSATFAKQRQYWLNKYTHVPEPLLKVRYHPQTDQAFIGSANRVLYLPRDFYRQLDNLAKHYRASVFHLFLAALYIYFTRTAQRNDFTIGLPVLNRANAQFKQTAGLFTGVSAAWFNFGTQLSCVELLQQIQKNLKADYRHQRFPISEVKRAVNLAHNRAQLFEVNLSYENHDYDAYFDPINSHITAMLNSWEQTPLIIFVRDFHAQADLQCDFVYNLAYFTQNDIIALQNHFIAILQAMVQQPTALVRDLTFLTAPELQQLQAWNQTAATYRSDRNVINLFEQQVMQTPDKVAVQFQEAMLTYHQLNARVNQLAHGLRAHPALQHIRNPLIALCIERSLDLIVGLLAILKAGAAYVPIDFNYPAQRITYLLNDSAAPVLLTQSHLQAQLPQTTASIVCVDDLTALCQSNPNFQIHANDLAYVIYTSGSTGQPKGVMIEHAALSHFAQVSAEILYGMTLQDRVLQFASVSFDAAVEEIFPTLLTGATLVLRTEAMLDSPETFLTTCAAQQISVLDLPTAYWQQLLNDANLVQYWPASVRQVIIGGEAATAAAMAQWQAKLASRCRLINGYGPTEATVVATTATFEPHQAVQLFIGKPIPNTRVYILDAHHQLQPIVIEGELCIAGVGLARGYLNRPELSAEKFVEVDLLGKTERIYKTGDLARWRSDGELEYLGRIDNQVKLRGFRIELGEIEQVLTQHPQVQAAVVLLYEQAGSKSLLAYLSVDNVANDNLSEQLRAFSKKYLPDYMIPSHFMLLDKLPLTVNGKIDRQALPEPILQRETGLQAPRNALERQLVAIWQRVLNREDISIHDNFFSLGGDSILSIQIVAQARQAKLALSPRSLFAHQTIAELASVVTQHVDIAAEQGLVLGNVPLTPIQQRFFATDLPVYWHYNQAVLLQTSSDLSVNALEAAFYAILQHHDALRLQYELSQEGGWQQYLTAMPSQLPFSVEDLSQDNSTDLATTLLQRTEHYQTSLNLTQGPLTRLVLFKLADSVRLFWCIHHLLVDSVSWRILLADLTTAYQQAAAGQTIQLPPKTSSFKAWAQHLQAYADSNAMQPERAYWQHLVVHPLPLDKATGQNRLEQTQHRTQTLDAAITQALLQANSAHYPMQDMLLAALALALQAWTGHAQCTIDVETHGRVDLFKELDLARTVGWFTSIHPLTLTLAADSDVATVVQTVQTQRQAVPNEGIGHGLLTYLCAEALPKGDVLFNYLGQFNHKETTPLFHFASEATFSPISYQGEREYLIEINALISQAQLQLTWSFSQDCYAVETIESLINHYQYYLQLLAQYIQTQADTQFKPQTALLLKSGTQPILFCLPGLGGKAGYFHALAQQLATTQTIYALESPGLDGKTPIPRTVTALAQQHLALITDLQVRGQPYYLLGHSFGAVVALELAWQLEQAGNTVAFLGLVDQPTPRCITKGLPTQMTEFDSLWRIVEIFQHLVGLDAPFDAQQLQQMANLHTACATVMAWLKQHEVHEFLFSTQGQVAELLAYINVYQANESAFLNYTGENRILHCGIELFCTADSQHIWTHLPTDWGWRVHAEQVKVHALAGGHFNVFTMPYVQDLAGRLGVCLNQNLQN